MAPIFSAATTTKRNAGVATVPVGYCQTIVLFLEGSANLLIRLTSAAWLHPVSTLRSARRGRAGSLPSMGRDADSELGPARVLQSLFAAIRRASSWAVLTP